MQPRQSTTSAAPSGSRLPHRDEAVVLDQHVPDEGIAGPAVMGTTQPPRSTVRSAIWLRPTFAARRRAAGR